MKKNRQAREDRKGKFKDILLNHHVKFLALPASPAVKLKETAKSAKAAEVNSGKAYKKNVLKNLCALSVPCG